jgi:hypothetical protein
LWLRLNNCLLASLPFHAGFPNGSVESLLGHEMRVLLQDMIREPERGRVRMTVQFGDEPTKQFLGDFDAGDGKFKTCNVELELFMRLSDLAAKRFCNCAIYQMELMGIISAFLSNKTLPPFPIELGTTDFGLPRPTPTKIFFGRIKRPFLRAWSWWKCRHIRRENLLKYGKRPNEKA